MRRIILVLLTFLLVSGCSKSNISTDTLTFVGESQHWKAQLIIALLKEDEIIKVSVEWNGNKEQFELRLLNSN